MVSALYIMAHTRLTLDTLRRLSLLASLPDETLGELCTHMQLTRYSKRDIVIQKGSHGYDLLFLLNGRLQVVDVTDDGREVGLSFILPGSFFGELSIIDNLPRSASVLALTTADVISLPKEIALRLFYHTPVIAEMIVKHLAKVIRQASAYRALLSIGNAFQRVCALLCLVKQVMPSGLHVVEQLPTQQEIAIMINTSRETVSRALNELSDQGVIEKDQRRLLIRQPEELDRMARMDVAAP